MDLIKVLVKEPGKPSEVREIENTLEAMQQIVGGRIEGVYISDGVYCYINEEGKLKDLAPNFVLPLRNTAGFDIICGAAVFFRAGLEGNETDLTFSDILRMKYFLKKNDVRNRVFNGCPLPGLWEA